MTEQQGQSAQDIQEDLLKKYKERLQSQFSDSQGSEEQKVESRQYKDFRRENLPPHLNLYEKLCAISAKTFRVSPDKKKAAQIQEAIEICHLNVTVDGTYSFALMAPLLFIVVTSLASYFIFGQLLFVFFFLIIGLVMITVLQKLPEFLAEGWRMQASNQMVLCIFYVVTYMRHTSNLELAVNFAAEHLTPPLSTDLKKVIWGMETQKYSSVKEALDAYLETWRKWNLEFIESFHLIESSLYESSEDRRLSILDKSLTLMLDETYEKMLHYAHNLKSPITMLHMLGIILPILGLVVLPLVINFIPEVKWYHIALLYNIALPLIVYYLMKTMLSKRPTGYGDVDISDMVPEYKKFKNIILKIGNAEIRITPLMITLLIIVPLILAGLSPLILYKINPDLNNVKMLGNMVFLGYRPSQADPKVMVGPYGIGASLLGLCVPLGIGLGLGIFFRTKSQNLMKIRNDTKALEDEFASAIFQLGNRIGDGLPIEIACGKVGEIMQGTVSGEFFMLVSTNVTKLGMGITQAIFDSKVGALKQYPSALIESTMKVLVQTSKKGVLVVSQALMNVSRYIKEIHLVNERLKDLLADIISSMKSQISFLTPVIAGIVVGITSMITTIIGNLNTTLGQSSDAMSDIGGLTNIFSFFGEGIPTYYFQMIVGIYVVEITYILILLSNGIENGADSLGEENLIGNSMTRCMLLYTVICAVVMIAFNVIATQILFVATGTGGF